MALTRAPAADPDLPTTASGAVLCCRAAPSGARARHVGLSVVATLLEREDGDQLWEHVMGPEASARPGQGLDSIDL